MTNSDMTNDELRTLVASLAIATARNTENIDRNTEAVNSLRESIQLQTQSIENIDRNTEAVNSLRESIQLQAQSIENIQENLSYNTQIVADGLELAAASNRTAAAAMELSAKAMELSANTMRAIDKLGDEIADLKQIVGIVISDNRADRSRIANLEGQN
jgi:methyl-accepting chemotaxis protein